jgi:hypothetical protein
MPALDRTVLIEADAGDRQLLAVCRLAAVGTNRNAIDTEVPVVTPTGLGQLKRPLDLAKGQGQTTDLHIRLHAARASWAV